MMDTNKKYCPKRASHLAQLLRLTALLLLGSLVSACGSGSGAAVTEIASSSTPNVSNYTGPAPATADVQNFRLAVWDNLVPNNRCGACHNDSQSPRFVRSDDINLAYDAANTVVNLTDPANSRMVTIVRGGHNCWLTDDNACADIIQGYVSDWAGEALNSSGTSITLTAPSLKAPGASKNFPESSADFGSTVYPLLTTYCSDCHSDTSTTPQQPFFASANIETAYSAVKARIDLDTPSSSRLVARLGAEFHNCWSNCSSNAMAMDDAITQLSNGIELTEIDPDLVTSMALTLPEGIVAAAGGRIETNIIALYEFQTGSGSTAFDTSGVEPALNLTLSGDADWVGGWGISMVNGKAQGSTSASAKLYQQLTSTNEYSIEAWVVPANVTQDGPARIISYSGGTDDRNFMLGQTLYDYDVLNRTDQTGADGQPVLSTPSDEEVLQATLQHVVATYTPTEGRRVYVNGVMSTPDDDQLPGLLTDWNDTYALAIGSEVDNNNRWAGTVRMLAIHSRALNVEQVQTNFEAGVGERYYLLFNVSDHVDMEDAYIVFEVSQFDSYAYLFDTPFFTVLGSENPTSIPVKGMRIGVNGREVLAGQAYANLETTIDAAAYTEAEGRLALSPLGTVVGLEKGPELDEFFLTFEELGDSTNVFVEAAPPAPQDPPNVPRAPSIGIRDFAEVNASFSAITGIATTNPNVANTFNAVSQALPISPAVEGFISSQQMAVTQLAIQYCNELVDSPSQRAEFFPGFDFNAELTEAFKDSYLVIDPLIARGIGDVNTQPNPDAVRAELTGLIDRLSSCGTSCEPDRTERVVKGTCAAVLGSAAVLVQ